MATTFELHNDRPPIFRYAPSLSTFKSNSTPIKNTSINSQSELKTAVSELLWSEMSEGGWVQDDRLIDHFKQDPRKVLPLDLPEQVDSEDDLYEPLASYFNAIAWRSNLRVIDTSKYSPRSSQGKAKDLPESPGLEPGKQSLLRPDLLGMHMEDTNAFAESVAKPDGETSLYWVLVRLIWEIKKTSTPAFWLEAREQVTLYARQIFRNHPGRRFVYSIVWCHPMFEVWMFDSSGGVVSKQYDLFHGPATKRTVNPAARAILSRVIFSLSKFDDAGLGYDPNFTLPPIFPSRRLPALEPYKGAVITFPATDSHPEEHFILDRELFSRNGLRGRGTRAWVVERQTDKKRFVLKDSWQDATRTPEWDWYAQVPEGSRSTLARIYRYCIVTINGEHDSTELARGVCGIKDAEDVPLRALQLRVHHRILFETVGELLKGCTDFNEVLRCFVDAVKAHRALFEQGILHRDISVNNILIDRDRNTGILIDLDHAAKVEADGGVISNHRSGTILFMAHEVMSGGYDWDTNHMTPFRHGVQHDLESFVWVLLYLAVTTPEYDSALQLFQHSLNGPAADMGTLVSKKLVVWLNPNGLWTAISSALKNKSNGPHPLQKTLDKLRQLLLDLTNGPQSRPVLNTLYDNFIKALEDGIVHPKRPMPPPKAARSCKRAKTTALRTSQPQDARGLRPRTGAAPNYRS